MTTGLDLRHEGQTAVIAADTAPHRGYGEYVRDAIDSWVALGTDFTADEVRSAAQLYASRDGRSFDPHPNLLPAILGGYVSAGRIVRVSDYHSGRKSRRYGRNGVYRAS